MILLDEEDAELTQLIQRARAYTSEKKKRHRPLQLSDPQATPIRKTEKAVVSGKTKEVEETVEEKKENETESAIEEIAVVEVVEESVEEETTAAVHVAVSPSPTVAAGPSRLFPFVMGLVLGGVAGWLLCTHQDLLQLPREE